MFCPRCGNQVPVGSHFCGKCGACLAGNANSVPTDSITDGQTPAPATPQPTNGTAPKPAKKTHHVGLWIGGVLVVVIGVLAALFFTGTLDSLLGVGLRSIPEGTYFFGSSEVPAQHGYEIKISDGGEFTMYSISDGEPEIGTERIGSVEPIGTVAESTIFGVKVDELTLAPSEENAASEYELMLLVPNSMRSGNPVGNWAILYARDDPNESYVEYTVLREDGELLMGTPDNVPLFTDDTEFWTNFFDDLIATSNQSYEEKSSVGSWNNIKGTWSEKGEGVYSFHCTWYLPSGIESFSFNAIARITPQ